MALQFGELQGLPSVQPRNVDAISEHYTGHMPNERIVTLGQNLSSFALRPDIEISPLDSIEIQHHVEGGGVLLIVGNHVKGIDPLTFSAAVNDVPAFEVVKHKIIIPSKPAPFRTPGVRRLADGMGAFPVIRPKDVTDKDGSVTKENKAYQSASGKFTYDLMTEHLAPEVDEDNEDDENSTSNEAGSGFLFPEGERNKIDPLVVQDFEQGAIAIYERALRRGANVAIVVSGVVYDANSIFRSTVHIGGLFVPEGKGFSQKTESLKSAVQHSVNEARRIGHRNR